MFLRSILLVVVTTMLYTTIVTAQNPAVSPRPAFTPPPAASPTATPDTGFATLQMRLRQSLARPEIQRGSVGVKIVSLTSGKVVLEQNAEKYFMPASNMKNFTVATAIERLTPDFRFITSLYASAAPDVEGTLKGDLRIFGRGDVSMSTRFSGSSDAMTSLDVVVNKIMSLGIKKIDGAIVGDDSYFRGFPIPSGWEWDDLQWSYGSEVSALPLNDSTIDISVRPGSAGSTCTVKLTPYNPVIRVVNTCMTTPGPRTLRVHKRLDQNLVEVSGTMPANDPGFNNTISVSRPAELFAALLRQRLIEKGIAVTGNYRYERRPDASLPTGVEIGKIESPPLALIAAQTMKPSQNMYTETLLWTLGEQSQRRSPFPTPASPNVIPKDSADLGIADVKAFLTGIGVASDGIIQYDGSGLSRHNLITPSAVVQLYTYMAKQSRFSQAWRDSLTIGGVDGTLRNRFRGTRAASNVRGKTGTIDQVSALSGYVKTAAGEELVFSMVVNGVAQTSTRVNVIDEMVTQLANFTGKIDQ